MRYCIDCKYFGSTDMYVVRTYCFAVVSREDPIVGYLYDPPDRSENSKCGPEGKLFAPKIGIVHTLFNYFLGRK